MLLFEIDHPFWQQTRRHRDYLRRFCKVPQETKNLLAQTQFCHLSISAEAFNAFTYV